MPVQVSLLTEPDIPGAISSIQEAFDGDPYNEWVYDKSKLSLTRNRVSLGIRCHFGLHSRNCLFYVAKDSQNHGDKVLAIAMWVKPQKADKVISWGEWASECYEDWKLWFQQVGMNMWYGRGGLNVKRYYLWKARQRECQSELWTDPKGYYFCNIVTVLPSEQGKGIGKALFERITKQADKEGVKCYLESSRDEPNTKIYERLGFRKVKTMICDDDGSVCKIYCMIRDPVES